MLALAGWSAQVVAGVFLVGTAAWAAVRARLSGASQRASQTIRLSAQHAVHVLEIDGRSLLIGTGPNGPPALLLELRESSVRSSEGQGDV